MEFIPASTVLKHMDVVIQCWKELACYTTTENFIHDKMLGLLLGNRIVLIVMSQKLQLKVPHPAKSTLLHAHFSGAAYAGLILSMVRKLPFCINSMPQNV